MEKIAVKDLIQYQNQEIDIFLLVTKKEMKEGKNNNTYIRVDFIDNTGPVIGNIWNNALLVMESFEAGDVVKIRAAITHFKDQIQLNIKKIRRAEVSEYDFADFIPKTKKDMNYLTEEFMKYLDSVKDEYLNKLLHLIFDDHEIWAKFSQCPAAKNWHHNYLGGLLEHTLTVVQICDFSSRFYSVKRDELITGAMLHDFGKIFEYTTIPIIEFSDEGRLLGHIMMGDEFIISQAHKINLFPQHLLMKLRHLIISHHGEMEKGAVKVPQTLEAVILHFADNLDAQAKGTSQLIEAATDPKARWTEFDRINNRYIYLK